MTSDAFSSFLNSLTAKFTPVVQGYDHAGYVPLDLSKNNKQLQQVDVSSSRAIGKYVDDVIAKNAGKIAYGGYDEQRSIYDRSLYFSDAYQERRNIHLGMDLWCRAGSDIIAPLDGTVHSYADNNNHGDYGPCIILEHRFEGEMFYTLYGHLSRLSLDVLKIGDVIKQGEVVARLGESFENGDYAPHLHFQVIRDMQGNMGDYPGVCTQTVHDFYLANCPDPNLILKI
ncbi:MAG: peptidase M23 [Cytophagaceae bacterium]|mgnify:FL=1|nr:peptidase M23 [Cytophagaceae bacterium]|tara:strand:- start:8780 stop:9463 length:684 start_codon:yes stop_codon:yes gene_type:complete